MAAQIVQGHLFGEAPSPAADIVDAPDSDLRLTGVIASGAACAQFAILVAADGRSRLFRKGEPIPGGGTLDDIGVDDVLVRQGSQRFRIQLPRRWLGGSGGGNLLAGIASAAAPGAIDAGTASTLQLVGLRTAATASNGALALSGSGPGTWRTAGLQASDVIIAIDGVAVASILGQSGALDRAVQASVVTLTVERDGQQLDLQAQQPRTIVPRRRPRRA